MPIVSTTAALTTTPVKVLDERRGRRAVWFTNETGGNVHVSGPTLSSTTGIVVRHQTTLAVPQEHENDFTPSHEWWARTDAGTGTLIVTYATEDSTD